jgi:hypothetical protein
MPLDYETPRQPDPPPRRRGRHPVQTAVGILLWVIILGWFAFRLMLSPTWSR